MSNLEVEPIKMDENNNCVRAINPWDRVDFWAVYRRNPVDNLVVHLKDFDTKELADAHVQFLNFCSFDDAVNRMMREGTKELVISPQRDSLNGKGPGTYHVECDNPDHAEGWTIIGVNGDGEGYFLVDFVEFHTQDKAREFADSLSAVLWQNAITKGEHDHVHQSI